MRARGETEDFGGSRGVSAVCIGFELAVEITAAGEPAGTVNGSPPAGHFPLRPTNLDAINSSVPA